MKIINSYDEIDRKSLKVGDSFLLLHDKDNFSSYQFEEKDDFIYKFKVNLPSNYIEPINYNDNKIYYRDTFIELDDKLLFLNKVNMTCYDYYFDKNKKFIESTENRINNAFSNEFINFLISENILENDYYIKTNKVTISEELDHFNKENEVIYNYLAINKNDKIILLVGKFIVETSDFKILFSILNSKKETLNNMFLPFGKKKVTKKMKEEYIYKLTVGEIERSLRLFDVSILKQWASTVKNEDMQRFCRLNLLLYKFSRPGIFFKNIDNIVNQLNNSYKLNLKSPISLITEFYGYKCYNIKNSCYIIDTRTNLYVSDGYYYDDVDLSKKYLKNNNQNLILISLEKYFNYYILKRTNEVPPLFKDVDLNALRILYNENNKYFICEHGHNYTYYRRLGPFFINCDKDEEIFERYELVKKLEEAK